MKKEIYGRQKRPSINESFTGMPIKTVLHFIHGQETNNRHLYNTNRKILYSLKALSNGDEDGPVAYESHSYQAKESIFHVLLEQDTWSEKYDENKV